MTVSPMLTGVPSELVQQVDKSISFQPLHVATVLVVDMYVRIDWQRKPYQPKTKSRQFYRFQTIIAHF